MLFTVLIAEKEYIDNIGEYDIFLKTFLDRNRVALCEWKPDRPTLDESVPELKGLIAGRTEWRAFILCPDEGISQKNPFDLNTWELPVQEKVQSDQEDILDDMQLYLDRVFAAKETAWRKAAQKPLVRLTTHLCPWPATTNRPDLLADPPQWDPVLDDIETKTIDLLQYREYLKEEKLRHQILQEIVANDQVEFELPRDVICIAMRSCHNEDYDIPVQWKVYQEEAYSDFCERNFYLGKLRYMVFDVLPKTHENYYADYIRFLATLLILCSNTHNFDVLTPNRVFRIECEHDVTALSRLLVKYNDKLQQTEVLLKRRIESLEAREKQHLIDRDVEALFCTGEQLTVVCSEDVQRADMTISDEGLGLSTDCPDSEEVRWEREYRASHSAFRKFFKGPRRAVKRAVTDMHNLNHIDNEKALLLDAMQREDVQEFTDAEEMAMLNIHTEDLYDLSGYYKQLERANRDVSNTIDCRITRRTTLFLGLVSLVVLLLAFVPFLIQNLSTGYGLFSVAIIAGASVACFLIIVFLILLFSRRKLKNAYEDYNQVVRDITTRIYNSLSLYADYLSHACNVMRGYSVLNYYENHDDQDATQLKLYHKHLSDVTAVHTKLRQNFGQFLRHPELVRNYETIEPYSFDYTRAHTYSYDMPREIGRFYPVEFLCDGTYIKVPMDFIRKITVRREELYD